MNESPKNNFNENNDMPELEREHNDFSNDSHKDEEILEPILHDHVALTEDVVVNEVQNEVQEEEEAQEEEEEEEEEEEAQDEAQEEEEVNEEEEEAQDEAQEEEEVNEEEEEEVNEEEEEEDVNEEEEEEEEVNEEEEEEEEVNEDEDEEEEEEEQCLEQNCGFYCCVCGGSHCHEYCYLKDNYFIKQIEMYSNGLLPTKFYYENVKAK